MPSSRMRRGQALGLVAAQTVGLRAVKEAVKEAALEVDREAVRVVTKTLRTGAGSLLQRDIRWQQARGPKKAAVLPSQSLALVGSPRSLGATTPEAAEAHSSGLLLEEVGKIGANVALLRRSLKTLTTLSQICTHFLVFNCHLKTFRDYSLQRSSTQ